jgi:hypothetical protein
MPLPSQPNFLEVIFKKSLIAAPFLAIVFLVYGVRSEHGDLNWGLMYPIAFALQYLGLSVVSYTLYLIADNITRNTKMNFIKNFIHLVLGVCLFWFREEAEVVAILLTLSTLLVINLATSFYNSLNEPV